MNFKQMMGVGVRKINLGVMKMLSLMDFDIILC